MFAEGIFWESSFNLYSLFIPFLTFASLSIRCISFMESEKVKAMRNLRYYMAQLTCVVIASLIVAPETE